MTLIDSTSRRMCVKYPITGLLTLFLIQAAGAEVVPVPTTVKAEQNEEAKPRNVVFILSDDHRYDAMSFMGHPLAKTPHMDAMAKNGAHLKNAFVTTSLCSPSRASILTGLYTFRHRVIDNQRAVPDGTLFFPQYLQQAGYQTGFVVNGIWAVQTTILARVSIIGSALKAREVITHQDHNIRSTTMDAASRRMAISLLC